MCVFLMLAHKLEATTKQLQKHLMNNNSKRKSIIITITINALKCPTRPTSPLLLLLLIVAVVVLVCVHRVLSVAATTNY